MCCGAVCMLPTMCRTMFGVPVTISDSQLFIPQPEWDALANEARDGPSFALQLQGKHPNMAVRQAVLLELVAHPAARVRLPVLLRMRSLCTTPHCTCMCVNRE